MQRVEEACILLAGARMGLLRDILHRGDCAQTEVWNMEKGRSTLYTESQEYSWDGAASALGTSHPKHRGKIGFA